MALSDILQAIRSGAEAEAAAIASTADDEVAGILEEANQSAEAERSRLAGSREAETARATDRIVNQAQLEADRQVRVAAEQVYAGIVEQAVERLAHLRDDPNYRQILGELIDECRGVMPDATTIHVAEPDAQAVAGLLAKRPGACDVEADLTTIGGVVAAVGNQRFVDNTFESRLARADPSGRQLVAELIPALGSGQ